MVGRAVVMVNQAQQQADILISKTTGLKEQAEGGAEAAGEAAGKTRKELESSKEQLEGAKESLDKLKQKFGR
jgi:hypothetical protein